MQSFYFLVKFGLVLIFILKAYRKKPSSILSRKNIHYLLNYSIHYLHFPFEKSVPSEVFENFLC